ncbi:MAG: VWA domain-containing protein [Polyangiaceae bacterium]|nr:VWA domain-containing protein [Polyangiaceae bacterium]
MADPYRTPIPFGGGSSNDPANTLSLHAAPVHPAARPDEVTTSYVVIKVKAEKQDSTAKRPKLSAVLVLDASGSMQGEPIAQVLHSARRLAEILDDTDRLGVVTFENGAQTIAPLLPLGQARRELIYRLSSVQANGGTNIAGGLAQSALLFPRREFGERHLMILMSDGEPNVGPRTAPELKEQAKQLKSRDLAISTLGFGANHQDEILNAIAEGGGGRYTFVIDPKLAESSFIRALGAQLDVVAEKVEVLLTPGPDIDIVRVLEDPPCAFGAGGLRVTLPDLIVGDELNIVVEVRVRAPREPGPMRALSVKLSATVAGTGRTIAAQQTVEILCTRTGTLDSDPVAHALASIALAAEMRSKARILSDRGSYADAEALLRKAQQVLVDTPGFKQGENTPLGDAYETLADDILVLVKRPAREEYEQYKRAARDYMDFASGGTSVRGGGKLGDMPASTRALLDKARGGVVLPRAFVRVLSGPNAGSRIAITKERFVIGRMAGCDLPVPDPNVSRQHSMIEFVHGAFLLVDMGSTNGPIVNGQRVSRIQLHNGMEFQIGGSVLRYETEAPSP